MQNLFLTAAFLILTAAAPAAAQESGHPPAKHTDAESAETACAAEGPTETPFTQERFEELQEKDALILVDIFADWCPVSSAGSWKPPRLPEPGEPGAHSRAPRFPGGGGRRPFPCVWPLVPVVMASASMGGRRGAVGLAAGLSVSFALVLLAAGLASRELLRRWRPGIRGGAAFGLRLLGGTLLLLGLLVLTGFDETPEAMAVEILPAWA